MAKEEKDLKEQLMQQDFGSTADNRNVILEQRRKEAQAFAETENGMAVLSDFEAGVSYIYAGSLGKLWNIGQAVVKDSSAFEEEIFDLVPPQELMERHITELRFFQYQKTLPACERQNYNLACLIHFRKADGEGIPILHRTYYLERHHNGSIWLSLCLYTPFFEIGRKASFHIVNNRTGESMLSTAYDELDRQLLSPRERSVLALLAKGQGSKQIAESLHISVNTVSRHRQNILSALQVNNTAAAVEIALRLQLIG